ncbi:uncharacterized protein CTRU02_209496 [Colletotrichum truncatum]|uniref:Uncharacterized protein n=1 Tax=Colletotrichum truncatum TaxID=5467 RepID=A0ACC3YSM9_COLTU|nr:uncharacterized protein CTRU02_08428 [Colletotrichum truncatum]KAF6789728.1 hypothetical protein CTRU02_08428 [Colletotrichum truncatum]
MTMRLIVPAVLLALAGTVLGQGACFVPNGTNRHALTNANIQKYAACENNGHSMCCNVAGDRCQPNGLCWNEEHKQLWRESCTDPTWQSHKCLKLCISDEYDSGGIPASGMDVLVTQCADGSYCCGNDQNATECCKLGKGVRIVDGEVITSSALSSSTLGPTTIPISSMLSSAISSATTTPTATDSETEDKKETSNSHAGVIGGAVGGGVGAMVLVIAALFFWHRRKKAGGMRGDNATHQKTYATADEDAKYVVTSSPPQYYNQPPSELPGPMDPVELGSDEPPSRR